MGWAGLDEFEKTLEATRIARQEHAGASADLDVLGVEIKEAGNQTPEAA